MKRQPNEWENIFANSMSDKELLFKIYKDIIHSIKKNYMGRELESTFSQRRQTVTKRQMKR